MGAGFWLLRFAEVSYIRTNGFNLWLRIKQASSNLNATPSTAKTSGTSTCASRFHRLLLHNLEMIFVIDCEQLEEIEEKEEEGMDTSKITLPRLKILWLRSLPELKSICSSSKVISCDSLEKIFTYGCPKLKRLPLSLPLLNGQLLCRWRMVGIVGVGLSRH